MKATREPHGNEPFAKASGLVGRLPTKDTLDEDFLQAVDLFIRNRKTNWPDLKVRSFVGSLDTRTQPEATEMGVRYLVRTMYVLLRKHRAWVKSDFADFLAELIKEKGSKKVGNVSGPLVAKLFLGTIAEAREVNHSQYDEHVGDRIAEVWSQIGSQPYRGKSALRFDRDGAFAARRWSKPSELYDAVEERLGAEMEADDPWVSGLHDAPDLDTSHLASHEEARQRLIAFLTAPNGQRRIFTLAGEALSGKTTVLADAHATLVKMMAEWTPPPPRVLYLDLAALRSFEAVVSRIKAFFDAQLGIGGGAPSSDSPWSGSTELKLRGIASAARRLGTAVFFLVNGAFATIQNGTSRGGTCTSECLLHDDRMDRLVEFLTSLDPSNRVVLAVSHETAPGVFARGGGPGGRLVDFTLPLLELRELKGMLGRFAADHSTSVDELGVLVDDLMRPLPHACGQGSRVGGRFLTSALALLWLARGHFPPAEDAVDVPAAANETLDGRDADEAALIRAASLTDRSVRPIIDRIYERLRDDPHGRVVVALLAFSNGSMTVGRLTDLLRHHRHILANRSVIADVPEGCSNLDRFALGRSDARRVHSLVQRLRFLLREHPASVGDADRVPVERPGSSTEGRTTQSDGQNQSGPMPHQVLELNKVLRPTLSAAIEEMDPGMASECHLLLARDSRRQGMRSRLDRAGAYGAALEDLGHDFAVVRHLLASASVAHPAVASPTTVADVGGDEWQVFTGSARGVPTILRFVAREVLEKDIDLGRQHRVTGGLQADDVVVGLMKRFFHLGRSAPSLEGDDRNLLNEGIGPLLANLGVQSVASITAKLAVAALQRHDFPTLWSAVGLEPRLLAAGAREPDLMRLRLVRLDALILTGEFRRRAAVSGISDEALSGAEDLCSEWLAAAACHLPDMPAGWQPHDADRGSGAVGEFVGASSRLEPRTRWLCGKILARLGEIAHLTTAGPLSLWYFTLADAIGSAAPDAAFPLLSGMSGRRWLAALLAHAGRCREAGDIEAFNLVKARAESVHRANLRRLGVFATERAGVVVDEAALERQVRGAGGAGDLRRAHHVVEDAYANALEASAPATVRLEFALERARCAMYLGELLQQQGDSASEGVNLVRSACGMARELVERIELRYTTRYGAPVQGWAAAYAIEARCSTQGEAQWAAGQSARIRAAKRMLPIGRDSSTLVDAAARGRLAGLSWRDEPVLA